MPAQRIGEEYPAKSGIIITPKFNPSGRKVWRVDIPATRTGGQREQRQFKNRELACEYAEKRSDELKREGHAAALLTAAQRSEAVRAYDALKLFDIGLVEAVALAIKHLRPSDSRISLSELQQKFIAAPGSRHGRLVARRKLSSDTMRIRTAAFVRYVGQGMAHEVPTGAIKEWMTSLGHLSPLTRNSYRLAVHAMFAFAVNEGHCAENPASKVKPFAVQQVAPSILSVDQAGRLVEKALATESELGPVNTYIKASQMRAKVTKERKSTSSLS